MTSNHPSHEGRFIGLNSQAAEQAFEFISRAKYSLRNFVFPHSTVMLMLILHLKNCRITSINEHHIGLLASHFVNDIKDFFLTPCTMESFGALNIEENNNDDDEESMIED
ncbi:unnamed protein product [Rotaria magnacalcarata]|uniref:Uncharacterized protein n=1 Tax=Rotaria magnacalcarata TaxID=392030 RepID=A0A816TDW6_9BILA|nr:unnamed protein product [Rotaria magnacalcarata]